MALPPGSNDPSNASDAEAVDAAKRALALERVTASMNRRVLDLLLELQKDIVSKLAALDPTQEARAVQRLKQLGSEVDDAITTKYQQIADETSGDLQELADDQARWKASSLARVWSSVHVSLKPKLASTSFLEALTDQPIVLGGVASDWWAAEGTALSAKFSQQMQIGIGGGENLSNLVDRVRGTRASSFKDGIMATSVRNANALVRTSVNSVSNNASMAVFEQNADVIEGVRHSSILDRRTTPQCVVRNGLSWTYPDLEPIGHDITFQVPPIHWNCRSQIVSILDLKRDVDKLTFDKFFNGLTDEEKAHTFGPGRAQLFDDGHIDQSALIDQSGRPLTVAELREQYEPGYIGPQPDLDPVKLFPAKATRTANTKNMQSVIDDVLPTTTAANAQDLLPKLKANLDNNPDKFIDPDGLKKQLDQIEAEIANDQLAKGFDPTAYGLPDVPKFGSTGDVSKAQQAANAKTVNDFFNAKIKDDAWQQYGPDVASAISKHVTDLATNGAFPPSISSVFYEKASKLAAKVDLVKNPPKVFTPPKSTPASQTLTQAQRVDKIIDQFKRSPGLPPSLEALDASTLKEFIDEWNLSSSMIDRFATYAPELTELETRVITTYTGNDYREINARLRRDPNALPQSAKIFTDIVEYALGRIKNVADVPDTLWRGYGTSTAAREAQAIESLSTDAVIQMNGIGSYSERRDMAEGWLWGKFQGKGGMLDGRNVAGLIWKLDDASKSQARSVYKISQNPGEDEYLFSSGRYFKVTKMDVETIGGKPWAVVTVKEIAAPGAGTKVIRAT